ncbi:MAG: hypothetical protein K0R73_1199 [Candidatus Midichloriaceae bacterium]|jgi:predicted PolB exonuclease-like 3'-5' exonuclease|nr:hypothetical protein [Candidatus Midichloriaceae bacterium]
MLPRKNIFTFDIETVIDTDMARGFLKLPHDLSDDEVAQKLEEYHLNITDGKNAFARQLFHKVVAIAFLHAEISYEEGGEAYRLIDLRAGGKDNFSEEELIKSFFAHLGGLRPRLVTFNGRTFDLPVLKYRAMKYGISAAWLYRDGDKWNNYNSRYSADWHCDLLDVLSDFGASAKVRMNEVCALLDLPGKLDVDGSKVADLHKNGKLKEIRDYCELDVANTYLIYLSYMRHSANISQPSYERAIEELHAFMMNNSNSKAHYLEFLENWRYS